MNVTNDSQQLDRSTSEITVNTSGLKSVKDQIKQQKKDSVGTAVQAERQADTVHISKAGAELSKASSVTSGNDSMEPSTVISSKENEFSSGGIKSVMARYREAQSFMAQVASGSINSTA